MAKIGEARQGLARRGGSQSIRAGVLCLLASILLVTFATFGRAEPSQFLCEAEVSSGLHYDAETRRWTPQAFVPAHKYLLRRITDADRDTSSGRKLPWLLKNAPQGTSWVLLEDSGSDDPFMVSYCSENQISNLLSCGSLVQFDKDSRRFVVVMNFGYIDQGFWEKYRSKNPEDYDRKLLQKGASDPEHPDDMYIDIGKCSPS